MRKHPSNLNALERRVLNALNDHAEGRGPRFATLLISAIACEANSSSRPVQAALQNLERLNVIKRELKPGPFPSRYVLL